MSDMLVWLKRDRKVSLRTVASLCGLSPSFLSMVLSGKRNFSQKHVDLISQYFDLNKKENNFFHLLIDLTTLREDRTATNQEIESLIENPIYQKERPDETEVYRYLTDWHNVAIREMAELPDFCPDPEWIQQRLVKNVSKKEIKKSLAFLVDHGLLDISATDGNIKTHKKLNCEDGVYRLSLGQFHSAMLKLASDSIGEVERKERLIMGHTEVLDENGFKEASRIIQEALEKISKLPKDKNMKTEVFHIELSLFPMTKKKVG